jgi:hypothetical protein
VAGAGLGAGWVGGKCNVAGSRGDGDDAQAETLEKKELATQKGRSFEMLQRHICCILGKRLLMALISTTGCSQVAAFANPEPVRLDVRRNRPFADLGPIVEHCGAA